jgi:hypothetical protein
MKYLILSLSLLNLMACASTPEASNLVILERSTRSNDLPTWTSNSETSWMKNEDIQFKGQFTIKGQQRTNACYDLAKGDARENIVSEMSVNFQSEINSYTQGISADENIELNKMFISAAKGKISGLRVSETVFERVLVNSEERINCFVVLSMSKKNYQENLMNAKSTVSQVNSDIIEKMKSRGLNFFSEESN